MNNAHIVQLEIHIQAEVLREIIKGDEERVGMIIRLCAGLFRKIIQEFKENFGRPPTKDELIWVCSEKMQKNIREL